MTQADAVPAVAALHRRFLFEYPHEAARQLEAMELDEAVELLTSVPPNAAARTWQAMASDIGAAAVQRAPDALARHLLSETEPAQAASVLAQIEPEPRARLLGLLNPQIAAELQALLVYPAESAGRVMDPQVMPVRADGTVGEALTRLRSLRRKALRELYVVDFEGRLSGRLEIQELAVAEEDTSLRELTRPLPAVVRDMDPREDVATILQEHPMITALPVINQAGRLVGVIRQAGIVSAIEEETSVDIQTMVGVSADERALSTPFFAVRKRLPWLQVNLLTAFLAAAVVGLFEGLIAKFTALAVLLPVVAGQSGNAGAQALAVTMRGLALREISLRHWPQMIGKEAFAGLANGIAVAATTALGVYVWSRSLGLVLVIVIAMIFSMVIAGLSGALVPILLQRFGQDPATASSIVLTTITDVVGFFTFLGTATLFASLLPQ
ncbi:MAG: magnesium transporter [Betaproteobacteria bacterium]|nr:magnesium transporter [Betaproteobacteria bacterium]